MNKIPCHSINNEMKINWIKNIEHKINLHIYLQVCFNYLVYLSNEIIAYYIKETKGIKER